MAKFVIEPHFRLQEWVAEEKGYFRAEGLDYEFRELVRATGGKIHDKGDKVGAYPVASRKAASPTSAAPATGPSTSPPRTATASMYADVYSVSPAGIFVPAD